MARLAEGRYIKMRKATEDMILKSTKAEFIQFILENAVVEEDEDEKAMFIPSGEHEFVSGKTYEMQGEEFKGDEFIITEDGRVFFALSLNTNWEVVDDPKEDTPKTEELSDEVRQEIKEQESKGNRLVKIDRNGSRHYRGKVKCDRCYDGSGLFATGTLNGQPRITPVDGGICHKCLGTGWVWDNIIIRTPEYEAKLAEQRAKRAEKKAEEIARKQKEEWEQNHLKSLSVNGFNPEGQTWVFLGNTYSIKETLKEMGAKFSWELGWHIDHAVEGYETMTLSASEITSTDNWGRIHFTITKAEADQKKQDALQKLHPTEISEYVGEVGKRLNITLTYTGTAHWEVDATKQFWNGRWGREETRDVYLHKFKDEKGNVFTWKTGNPLGYWDEDGQWVCIGEGTQITLKGTVKEHSEYKGIKQTVLTRCKVA